MVLRWSCFSAASIHSSHRVAALESLVQQRRLKNESQDNATYKYIESNVFPQLVVVAKYSEEALGEVLVEVAAEALAKRMTKVGFVLKAPLPPDLQASARTNDTALASFSKLKLTELTQFKGISADGGAKKLEAKGVTTTDALFAKFLSFCNEPKVHQPPEKAQEMYDWMKDAGLAKGGWAPTIIDQLVAKMKVGIDYGVDPDPKTGD